MKYLLRWNIRYSCLALLFLALNAFGSDLAVVYFYPFEIEPYAPITRENIVSQAWEKWTISSESQVQLLIPLLTSGGRAEFDNNRVRALICIKDQIFYMDAMGVVSTRDNSYVGVDKDAFIRFRNSLHSGERVILDR